MESIKCKTNVMTRLSIVPMTKYSEKEASATISLYLTKAFIDRIATTGIKLSETKDSKIIIRSKFLIIASAPRNPAAGFGEVLLVNRPK